MKFPKTRLPIKSSDTSVPDSFAPRSVDAAERGSRGLIGSQGGRHADRSPWKHGASPGGSTERGKHAAIVAKAQVSGAVN